MASFTIVIKILRNGIEAILLDVPVLEASQVSDNSDYLNREKK